MFQQSSLRIRQAARSRRVRRTWAAVPCVLAIIGVATPAIAGTCRGYQCIGQDPDASGCTGNTTLYEYQSRSSGRMQIRGSSDCRAAWSRTSNSTLYNYTYAQAWAGTQKRYLDTDNIVDAYRTGRVQLSSHQIGGGTYWGRMVTYKWLRACVSHYGFAEVPSYLDCQPYSSILRNPYWSDSKL